MSWVQPPSHVQATVFARACVCARVCVVHDKIQPYNLTTSLNEWQLNIKASLLQSIVFPTAMENVVAVALVT